MNENDTELVPRSLKRGLLVMESVAREPGGLTYTEIQQHLGLPKMTVSRLLNALCALEYLRKDDGGQYRRGLRFSALLADEPLEERLKRVCAEPLSELVRQTRNSGLLLIWKGADLVCLERILHEESIVLVPPGHRVQNLYLYPAGIFCVDIDCWESKFAQPSERLNEEGITPKWFERERERVRKDGYTMGHLPNRHRLSAPLTNAAGETLGALIIGGTPASLPDTALSEVGNRLANVARACSQKLADCSPLT